MTAESITAAGPGPIAGQWRERPGTGRLAAGQGPAAWRGTVC
jgi:hypothetical protein